MVVGVVGREMVVVGDVGAIHCVSCVVVGV